MEDMKYYLPQKIAFQLYLMDIQSVIVEGGRSILNEFISANLWDEARVFHSSNNWEKGLIAPAISGNLQEVVSVSADTLMIYNNHMNS
jgi:diaminohydroxyphosphoribosylaminopyrimidine deaminase/5-amino-6-(5-phosphoribosylamino)uracil reductase